MLAEDINYLKESIKNKNREIDYDTGIINRYGDYRFMKYTHCELHRWTMLGEIASGVPFINHNYGTKILIEKRPGKRRSWRRRLRPTRPPCKRRRPPRSRGPRRSPPGRRHRCSTSPSGMNKCRRVLYASLPMLPRLYQQLIFLLMLV